MVRKSKDLFVALAERQQRGNTKNGKDAGAAVREAGGKLGRWVQGAVKTMRPATESKRDSKGKSKFLGTSSGRARRSPPGRVPRGLLVPGWLLVGMVTVGIGCGFVVGRYTAGIRGDAPLSGGGVEQPREFDRRAPDLTAAQEVEKLSPHFYVCGTYSPQERSRGFTLARELRDHGIGNARVRAFKNKDGSIVKWATLCYVASPDDGKPTLEALQRLEGALRFKLWSTELQQVN